jgi:hypothetical protein
MSSFQDRLPEPLRAIIRDPRHWPLGIDIGWSPRKCSMAVASTIDVFTPFDVIPAVVSADPMYPLFAWEDKFTNVCEWVSRLPRELRALAVVAVDGPIGPQGRPAIQRYVDRACQSGQCHRRCPPASVTGGGQKLVQATYAFVEKLCDGLEVRQLFKAQPPPLGEACLLEVNPTVGLAWLVNSVEDPMELPARKRLIERNGRRFKQKSDYYWAVGASGCVADDLRCPEVAQVQHHERESALYALAVALCMVRGEPSKLYAIGKLTGRDGGVYHMLGPIHESWRDEYRRIGLRP